MKFKNLLLAFLICLAAQTITSQEEFKIEQITVINLGDGRLLFRNRQDEKPIEGERKIIDGYRSEYILADFKNGLYDGKYKLFKYNKLKEEGSFKEGLKDGEYIEYNSDGISLKSKIGYKEGKRDGMSISYYTDGEISKEKSYKNGLEDGPERSYEYQTGEVTSELNFLDGKKHGKQRQRMMSNVKHYMIYSEYENGTPVGEYSEIFLADDIVKTKGTYKNGKEDGLWIYNKVNGDPEKVLIYKNGKLDGECKYYWDESNALGKIENYKEEKKNGLERKFFRYDGKKDRIASEYNYVNGRLDGKYYIYKENGKIQEEGKYENGRKIN